MPENTDHKKSDYGHFSRSVSWRWICLQSFLEDCRCNVYYIDIYHPLQMETGAVISHCESIGEDLNNLHKQIWTLYICYVIICYTFRASPFSLTLSWRRSLSCRNQSIDLLCKSFDWFLYDRDLRNERVKNCGKLWTRKTYNTDTFYAVISLNLSWMKIILN